MGDLGEGPAPFPLILGKKKKWSKGEKPAGEVNQNRPPTPLAQGLDPPLQTPFDSHYYMSAGSKNVIEGRCQIVQVVENKTQSLYYKR